MKLCSIEVCNKKVFAKGWCTTHYQRWRFHGNPEYNHRLQYEGVCKVESCEAKKAQKDYCMAHYMRWYRHGDPLEGRVSPSKKRKGDNFCGADTCPTAQRLRGQLHYHKNKQDYVARAKAQPKEQTNKYKKNWKKKNPAKVLVHGRFRKRNLKEATPPWLTDEHWDQMNDVYLEAQKLTEDTGIEHHVDHIVPLKARANVRGLHVPWNLRVMTGEENMTRSR